jgi:diguanylate cyclase (GGDEF)-like protein
MAFALGIRAVHSKPLPLEGSGDLLMQQAISAPHHQMQVSRNEWWLWASALLVTALASIALLLSSFSTFFRYAEHFYEIRSDQARWATLCLLLVFNSWLLYRQWSFRRLRPQATVQIPASQLNLQQAAEAAGLDSVTGLCTRAALEQHLGREVARARRVNSALSLATIHVDGYVQLTAHYGKAAVETALKDLARHLKKASRGSDIAARLSDDDFVLLLPECGFKEVNQVLNRLVPIDVSSSGRRTSLKYTTGWVDYQPGDNASDILKRAVSLLHLYDSATKENASLSVR